MKRNNIGQLFREAQQSKSTIDVLFFLGGEGGCGWGCFLLNVSHMYSNAFFFFFWDDIQTYFN